MHAWQELDNKRTLVFVVPQQESGKWDSLTLPWLYCGLLLSLVFGMALSAHLSFSMRSRTQPRKVCNNCYDIWIISSNIHAEIKFVQSKKIILLPILGSVVLILLFVFLDVSLLLLHIFRTIFLLLSIVFHNSIHSLCPHFNCCILKPIFCVCTLSRCYSR